MALYSDPNQFSPTRVVLLEDEVSVQQSVENILATRIGSRFFNPEFGSQLEEFLFELIDGVTSRRITDGLIVAIQKWDNRVFVDTSNTFVIPDPDNNRYEIQIQYRIRGLQGRTFQIAGFISR